jgi:hypothetical protein
VATFDDREKGFEGKFAHDEEVEFKAVARRNRAMGAWAAERMGLEGDSIEEYTRAIIRAELGEDGDEAVIRKILQDLTASSVKVSEGEVRQKMQELMAQAREHVKSGE